MFAIAALAASLLASQSQGGQPKASVEELSMSTFTAFGAELAYFDKARPDNENLVFSPIGIQLAGAAVSLSASGQTQFALMKTFGVGYGQLNALTAGFERVLRSYGGTQEVGMHCSLWLHKASPNAQLQNVLARYLNTEMFQVGDVSKVHEMANEWVREATKNRIPQVLGPQTEGFRFCVVSANTFDGEWPSPLPLYPPNSDLALEFKPETGDPYKLPTLYTSGIAYPLDDNWEIVSKFYKPGASGKSRYAMLLIVARGSAPVREIASSLAPMQLRMTLRKPSPESVLVYFPKFRTASAPDLMKYMKAAGSQIAFGGDADFSLVQRGISLTIASHRAMIEVDEKGTKAAAATAIGGGSLGGGGGKQPPPPRIIRVDRPFVFVIYDRDAELPLFAGVVAKP